MERRITLKDVASASGFGLSTVSMALRDHAKIPEETRLQIKEIAQRIGYAKDPMLSALAAYRDQNRTNSSWRGDLAAIVLDRSWPWNKIPLWVNVFDSMHKTAKEIGYDLHEYLIDTDDISLARHQQILVSRGIHGLILPPIESFPYNRFDWDKFSVIGFGFDPHRKFHAVSTDNARATLGCIEKAIEAGYRRIGMILPEGMLYARHFREIGAFLATREMEHEAKLFFMKQRTSSVKIRESWVKQHDIDAIVGYTTDSATEEIYPNLPFVSINVPERDSEISGYHHPAEEIGATLVHQLHGLIIRGSDGIPNVQTSVNVAGIWNKGKTLPARKNSEVPLSAKR